MAIRDILFPELDDNNPAWSGIALYPLLGSPQWGRLEGDSASETAQNVAWFGLSAKLALLSAAGDILVDPLTFFGEDVSTLGNLVELWRQHFPELSVVDDGLDTSATVAADLDGTPVDVDELLSDGGLEDVAYRFHLAVAGSAAGTVGDVEEMLVAGPDDAVISAGGGADLVVGGAGDDAIDGGEGNDVLSGGAGHDFLIDDAGDGGVLTGGAGNDVLDSPVDDATLDGGEGNDLILAAWGDDDNTNAVPPGVTQTVVFGEGDGFDVVIMSLRDDDLVVIEGDVAGFTTSDRGADDYPDLLIRLDGGDAVYFPYANYMVKNWDEQERTTIVADNGSWSFIDAWSVAVRDEAAIAALDLDSAGEGASAPGGEMTGGSGADNLVGWSLSDDLSGDGGNDTLTGAGREDWLDGGAGNDTLYGGTGDDLLIGGNGNDSILGEAGDDTVTADAGSDSIDGGAGQDWIDASAAPSSVSTIDLMQQKLVGLGGQDLLLGIEHIQGSDYGEGVIGDDVANSLWAAGGNDHVWGNAGHDQAWGGDGNDDLHGGAGNDSLLGDGGDDTVDGQWGDDVLEGGDGDDSLIGGSGADRFVFYTFGGDDTVQDFTPGTDELELWIYNTTAAQVLAGATVSGADTLLHLYQTEIRLVGVAPSQLSTSDIVIGEG